MIKIIFLNLFNLGYEFDTFFGICFKNKCKQICGQNMSCAILKHNIDHFEYFCYCELGYQRIDPYYPKGCIPTLTHFKQFLENSEKKGFSLPHNPFLLELLGCDQIYGLDSKGNYYCDCYRGYKMNEETKKCEKIRGLSAHEHNNCTSNQILVSV